MKEKMKWKTTCTLACTCTNKMSKSSFFLLICQKAEKTSTSLSL